MTGNDARPASFLWAAAALGLALRLAFALGYWTGQPLTRDEHEYLSLARSVATGQGFVYDAEMLSSRVDPFGRAPGYPVFLALIGAGRHPATHVPASVKITQSFVGAGGVLLVGILAHRLAGPRASRAAALIAAVYPPLVWIAAYALSEAFAWPVGLAAAWLFDRASDTDGHGQRRLMFVAGVLSGLAILIRPAMIFFLLLAGLWLMWRRRGFTAAALVLGAALVVAPWTARNYQHHGRFVLIASEGGVTFWTGNHPRAIGEGDLAANPDLKRESLALRAQHPDLSEEQMEPVYYREALRWMRGHPVDWLRLEMRKVFYLAVPVGPSYRVHSTRYYVASVASYALLLPMAAVGFFTLGGRRRLTPGLWLLAGSAIVVCLIFFPQDRFRMPAIDPALIVSAGAAWAAAVRNANAI